MAPEVPPLSTVRRLEACNPEGPLPVVFDTWGTAVHSSSKEGEGGEVHLWQMVMRCWQGLAILSYASCLVPLVGWAHVPIYWRCQSTGFIGRRGETATLACGVGRGAIGEPRSERSRRRRASRGEGGILCRHRVLP